ncbi:Protein of unknown function, partial [Gryllus bimaculatus]
QRELLFITWFASLKVILYHKLKSYLIRFYVVYQLTSIAGQSSTSSSDLQSVIRNLATWSCIRRDEQKVGFNVTVGRVAGTSKEWKRPRVDWTCNAERDLG